MNNKNRFLNTFSASRKPKNKSKKILLNKSSSSIRQSTVPFNDNKWN